MKIEVGTEVAYSVQFLKSIAASHSELSHARGVVIDLKPLGSNQLAVVDWNNEEIPSKVLVNNLAVVGPNTKFCNCD